MGLMNGERQKAGPSSDDPASSGFMWMGDLFHQALSNACDGRAQDPDACADDVKEGGNDRLEHNNNDD